MTGRLISTAFRREFLLSIRNPGASLNGLWFFVLVAALFPIGIGPEKNALAVLAPGLLWVIALLAVMLSADSLFRDDYVDGSLEQMLLSNQSLYFMILTRILAQSLIVSIPLVFVSPLLGVLLGLSSHAMLTLIASLALGIPILVFIGAIGAALTVGFERGGLLLSLLILPLYIPVLIFGAAAVQAAAGGFPFVAHLSILAALLLLAIALAPAAVSASLRLHYYF